MLAARDYKQDSRITMDVMFDYDALDEVLSLADPYQAEPTSLANPCRPEVTRPVEEMKLCFCGGEYEGDQCQREDSPHCSGGNPALEPKPDLASSSSGGNPVKLEPAAVESDKADIVSCAWCLLSLGFAIFDKKRWLPMPCACFVQFGLTLACLLPVL